MRANGEFLKVLSAVESRSELNSFAFMSSKIDGK